MSGPWRLFLAALHFVTRSASPVASSSAVPHAAMRFVPLVGVVIGTLGAGAYWSAARIWPTSVAVVLSLLVMFLATLDPGQRALDRSRATFDARPDLEALYWVFLVLIKYNVLMALSAARVPFSLPADLTLGLILVAGQAASRALVVSVMATDAGPSIRVTTNDLTVALILGLAPAALLGIPGLIGLVAAIVARLGLAAKVLSNSRIASHARLEKIQQATEVCFYLGALATWKYV